MKLKRILKWAASIILLALILWGFIAYWTSTNDCKRYAAAPMNPIKAIIKCEYGVENLKLQEIEKPAPPMPAKTQMPFGVRIRLRSAREWLFTLSKIRS